MELLTSYLPTLKFYALKLTQNIQDSQDLLQDTAEKMIRNKVMDKPYEQQKAICKTSLLNTFLDRCRMVKSDLRKREKYYNPEVSTNPAIESKLDCEDILNILKTINPKHSQPLLEFGNGYSVNEIGKFHKDNTINITLSNIRYGRKALAKKIKSYDTGTTTIYAP